MVTPQERYGINVFDLTYATSVGAQDLHLTKHLLPY